jgi:hypothetical protein
MLYDDIAKKCEQLGYRDKLRLSQLLIQLARKEEEVQNPERRSNLKATHKPNNTDEPENDITSIQYVVDRILKLKPAKKKSLINSIKAMYQFQGGISEEDQEKLIEKLQKLKHIKIDGNNSVTYQ